MALVAVDTQNIGQWLTNVSNVSRVVGSRNK